VPSEAPFHLSSESNAATIHASTSKKDSLRNSIMLLTTLSNGLIIMTPVTYRICEAKFSHIISCAYLLKW